VTRTSLHKGVHFEKPAVRTIKDSGALAVDMHFHTNHSDAYTSVRAALALAKLKGVGLSITDHNAVSGAVAAHQAKSGVLLVPGMEVSAKDGPHILLYFYGLGEMVDFYHGEIEKRKGRSPYLATALSTEDILERTTSYNCVRAPAHPYGYLVFNKGVAKCVERQYLAPETLARFDAIEAINGGMTRRLNRKACDLALELGLGLVGGTDSHILKGLGNVLTCAKADDVEGFLTEVVHRRSFLVGRETSALDKALTAAMMVTRYVPHARSSMAVHYRQNMPRVRRFLRGQAPRSKRARARAKARANRVTGRGRAGGRKAP
jgi:predicted metal-dependent phosphoesterase TrpH